VPGRCHRLLRLLARALGDRGSGRLHVCVRCGGDFCRPVGWETVGGTRWRIELRCGGCGHERVVVVTDADAAEFDVVLDRHEAAMAAVADRLSRERLAVEVETFAAALADDLIGADDFGRSTRG
jgi:hypothetical protein